MHNTVGVDFWLDSFPIMVNDFGLLVTLVSSGVEPITRNIAAPRLSFQSLIPVVCPLEMAWLRDRQRLKCEVQCGAQGVGLPGTVCGTSIPKEL